MPHPITPTGLAPFLERAGVSADDARLTELAAIYPAVAAMIERNRTARGREAEPSNVFVPGEKAVA